MTEEYDNLQLETHPLNILFFLKKVDDEEIMESMNGCVRYILEKQQEIKSRLVSIIYAEDWVITKLPEAFKQQQMTKFMKWPLEAVEHSDKYSIDYIITIGGDGTILTLLHHLQDYEKTRILPPIITFSQVRRNRVTIIGLPQLPW
jgi:NAD kinase